MLIYNMEHTIHWYQSPSNILQKPEILKVYPIHAWPVPCTMMSIEHSCEIYDKMFHKSTVFNVLNGKETLKYLYNV